MNLHSLFPIPIGMIELDRSLSKKEMLFFNTLDTRPNSGNTTSRDNNILNNSTLTKLRSWIEDQLQEFFLSVFNPKSSVSLKITQSWVNYSTPGQFHHKHAHPNSFISGVFYIQTNPQDKIFFSREEYQQIKILPKNWNIWNSDSWWYEAIQGRLILFPSSLTHMVPKVEGNETRISLSFNTFPIGLLGEEAELTELKLEA